MNSLERTHFWPSRIVAALAVLVVARSAHAQPRPLATSAIEHALGASPVYMLAGHGRLTVGVTREGDVAVLTWPGPSCCDQLTFIAPNDPDARAQRRTGVRDGFGIALGLLLHTGGTQTVTWLHDADVWNPVPGYASDTVIEPRITYRHRVLGVEVTVLDAVLPDADAYQRRVNVTVPAGSTVTSVDLLAHTNFGLTLNVIPRVPIGDSLADATNDYGALWNETEHAALFFRPRDRGRVVDPLAIAMPTALAADYFLGLDALMRNAGDVSASVATALTDLDRNFGEGVYAYAATDPPATQFQLGREGNGVCDEINRFVTNVAALPGLGINVGLDVSVANALRCMDVVRPATVATTRGWMRSAQSAWDDAQDGTLSGNPVAAYLNDAAQRAPIALDATGHGEARLLVAFGRNAAAARDVLRNVRAMAPADVIRRDADAWNARAARIALPDTLPASIPVEDRDRIVRAARRAMLHVYAGTDAATGMIVASVARQAPYGLDWPRDGAFFDYALDVAGDPDATSRRLAWALPLQRANALTPGMLHLLIDPQPPVDPRTGRRVYPEAAWEMNYYDDGTMGGFFRFEIDNTALMIWSAASHVGFVPEAQRMDLARSYWDRVRRSADMLAAWRDAQTGLCAPAQEDDNAAFTQSLHGGTTVFAALEAAARLARFVGSEPDATRWEHRAGELRDVLVRRFYNARDRRFLNDVTGSATTNPGSAPLGPTAWLVWPSRLLPYDDPRVAQQVRFDLGRVLVSLRGDEMSEGGAYLTKNTLSAAVFLARGGDPSLRPLLEEAVIRLARDVITQDTQVMGEVFVTLRNPDGSVRARENRVSIPHIWEATLFYLTAMAMSHPERFELERTNLPANRTPAPGTVPFVPPMMDASADVDAGADAGGTPRGHGGCGGRTMTSAAGGSSAMACMLAMVLLVRRGRRSVRRGARIGDVLRTGPLAVWEKRAVRSPRRSPPGEHECADRLQRSPGGARAPRRKLDDQMCTAFGVDESSPCGMDRRNARDEGEAEAHPVGRTHGRAGQSEKRFEHTVAYVPRHSGSVVLDV